MKIFRLSRFWRSSLVVVIGTAALLAMELSLTSVVGQGISEAQAGNVTVAPTRVVFEGRDRSEELVLLNRGSRAVTYRISVITMKMNDQGRLERLEEPEDGQKVADDLIRFAPRQVHLEPGVAQRVRVMVRKPADLEEGEYRSHMLFQAVPEAGPPPEASDVESGQLALRLNIISGLSIPIIVRHGELSAHAELQDLEFLESADDDQPDLLELQLLRSGERSLYGDLEVVFVADEEDAEPVTVARRNGTALYTPNSQRPLQLALAPPEDIVLEKGRLVVTFTERSEDGSGATATEELALP